MITKSQAQALAAQYVNTLAFRVETFLQTQAKAGIVGGTFVISPADTGPKAVAVKAQLEADGWNVDTTNLPSVVIS